MSSETGFYLGYDASGEPVACATYGGRCNEPMASARAFCSEGGLTPRRFPERHPQAEREMARFRANVVKSDGNRSQGPV